jgi:hypothetical protein
MTNNRISEKLQDTVRGSITCPILLRDVRQHHVLVVDPR